jgi:hypothetical protein
VDRKSVFNPLHSLQPSLRQNSKNATLTSKTRAMIRYFTVLINFLWIFNLNLFSQLSAFCDKKFPDSLKFYGTYGLSDFVKSHKDLPYDFSDLLVIFDSSYNFSADAGNFHKGKYSINDSNKINFYNLMSTLVSIQIETSTGFKYSPDLFFDTLKNCNSFSIVGNEIRFFHNSEYRLSIKPYYDLLPFPIRENDKGNSVKEIKIDTICYINNFVIVNSINDKKKLEIDLYDEDINFENQSLVVIENISIQHNKNKELRNLAKSYKERGNQPVFPISYAKLCQDSATNKTYLDIVNTYTRAKNTDWQRRSRYSGFIINKVDIGKLELKIIYIK